MSASGSHFFRGFCTVCAVAGLAWWAHGHLIVPLAGRGSVLRQQLEQVREHTAEARKTLRTVAALEAQTDDARAELERLQEGLPEGAALVWFPERMRKHFRDAGFDVVSVLPNTAADVPELPGFERSYWAVELPITGGAKEIRAALVGLAGLETADSFVRILDAAVRPDSQNPARQVAVANVVILAPK
jgi:hypothetical protein